MQTWVTQQVRCMSKQHLLDICKKYKYVCLRCVPDNEKIAINCKVVLKSGNFKGRDLRRPTHFYSFWPCDLNEYISNKIPIIN